MSQRKTLFVDRPFKVLAIDPGLDGDDKGFFVNLDDTVHLFYIKEYPSIKRHCPALGPCSPAIRDHRNSMP